MLYNPLRYWLSKTSNHINWQIWGKKKDQLTQEPMDENPICKCIHHLRRAANHTDDAVQSNEPVGPAK